MSGKHSSQLHRYRYLFVLSLFTVLGHSNSAVPVLSIEPSNMTTAMGGTVRFSCRAEESSELTVNWIREDTIISTDRVISNNVDIGRYSVIGVTDDDFDLQIIDVKPYDEAAFKCQATKTDGSGTVISPFVYFTVHYPPNANRLRCYLGEGTVRVEVGDNLEAICVSQLGVPPAELQWATVGGDNVTTAYKDPGLGTYVILRFKKNITIEDKGKEFTCILRHPLLTQPSECTIGPLDVYHAPLNATIISSSSESITEGDDLDLTCSADVNPENDVTFAWYTEPRYKGKTTYTSDRATIHFSNAPISLNSTIVICNATNSRGFSTTSTAIIILSKVTQEPLQPKPTRGAGRFPTAAPMNFPNTQIIVFILMGVIFVLLLGIVVILIIGRKWREPVIVLDVNDEVCRRSLSGGGSLVFGSASHNIVLHHTPNSERHLLEIHQGRKDSYSVASSSTCCSHHGSDSVPCDHDNYPSDPQKAAKIEGTEFYRSAHTTSRHNSIDSACSDNSHYERSICSSTHDSKHGQSPYRSRDPLPPTPDELIPMTTLNANHTVTLEDEEHHAETNLYMNSSKKRSNSRSSESRDNASSKRDSGEHNYEDLTPVSKRKMFSPDLLDTGEEDFPDDDKPRVTPETQFGEVKDKEFMK